MRQIRFLNGFIAMLVALLLAACGGGGGGSAGTNAFGSGSGSGSGSGGSGTTGQPMILLALSTTTVTGAAPATVTATVRDATGAGVAGQVVQFTTASGLGAFSAPSALTDANGVATVSVRPATTTTAGADTIVATTNLNGADVTAQAGFQLTATQVTIAGFTSDIAGALAAHGQANLNVALAGFTPGVPVDIAVSSACVANGRATLTPTNATTSTGTATFTYRDNGCGATDSTDVVQASVTGTSATASLTLTLTSPAVASIAFVSANPSTIFLKGSGFTESSTVTFQVRDASGNGLANKQLTLELVTAAGGVTIDDSPGPITKLSDTNGNVVVRINSGTVPTPVRVRATLTGTNIATVSSALSVAVGLPSQLNFSLSQTTINVEGLDHDGTTNEYHIIASDRLANPVPDGTAINFVAEGGQVQANRFTALSNGLARATANFITAEPRPIDGRVTVVAYALGEESFLDQNGNNVFDAAEPFQDLGNIFISRSFNFATNDPLNGYVATDDQFVSLSISGSSDCASIDPARDPANLLARNRSIPSIVLDPRTNRGTCDGLWGRAYVRRATETVFSSSNARPLWFSDPVRRPTGSKPANLAGACLNIVLQDDHADNAAEAIAAQAALRARQPSQLPPQMRNRYHLVGGSVLYNVPTLGTVSFLLADANGFRLNPMPAGTTVTVTATDGMSASVAGGSPVPSTSEATFLGINYNLDPAPSGTITVNVESPRRLVTSISFGVSSQSAPAGTLLCP